MAFKTGKIFAVSAMTFFCLNVSGQDLIARQAPIDRKLKIVDSVALVRQIKAEQSAYPAYDLYPSWTHEFVNAYGSDVQMPDTFRISLEDFCMPTESTKITDVFGYRPRRRRMHYGLDVKVFIGDTIRAAFAGKVRIVKDQGRRKGYGKYVVIRHENGLETVYGHLSRQLVSEDQYVEAGEPIALGGNSGRSSGSHLHFETRFLGQPINPAFMFDFEKQDVLADTYLYRKGVSDKYIQNRSSGGNTKMATGTQNVRYYKVRSGDSLGKIAQKTGVSINTLCRLNNITRNKVLRPGQVLRCS